MFHRGCVYKFSKRKRKENNERSKNFIKNFRREQQFSFISYLRVQYPYKFVLINVTECVIRIIQSQSSNNHDKLIKLIKFHSYKMKLHCGPVYKFSKNDQPSNS